MRISFVMPDGWTVVDAEELIKRVNEDGKAVTLSPRNSLDRIFVQVLKQRNTGLKVRVDG